MRSSICHESPNSVVLSASDWDSMELLLKSITSAPDRDGAAVVITMRFPSAPNTIEARLEFMD
jgi:hypothetical protein